MRTALMDGNPVALLLRSNYLSLSRDNGIHSGGNILNRKVDTTLRPIAVEGLYGKAGKLKDGLTYSLAGDCAGMNAHAAHHGGPVDHGDALAHLCRGDSSLLPRRATADYHQVVLCYGHLGRLTFTIALAPLVSSSGRFMSIENLGSPEDSENKTRRAN